MVTCWVGMGPWVLFLCITVVLSQDDSFEFNPIQYLVDRCIVRTTESPFFEWLPTEGCDFAVEAFPDQAGVIERQIHSDQRYNVRDYMQMAQWGESQLDYYSGLTNPDFGFNDPQNGDNSDAPTVAFFQQQTTTEQAEREDISGGRHRHHRHQRKRHHDQQLESQEIPHRFAHHSHSHHRAKRAKNPFSTSRWPAGVVYYSFATSSYSYQMDGGTYYINPLGSLVMSRVSNSFTAWEEVSCLDFVHVAESDLSNGQLTFSDLQYMAVKTNGVITKPEQRVCAAQPGYPGQGNRHAIWLASPNPTAGYWPGGCLEQITQHELGHVAGMKHTQTRPDRGDFVHVQPDSFIGPQWAPQFAIDNDDPDTPIPGTTLLDKAQAVYESIMLYRNDTNMWAIRGPWTTGLTEGDIYTNLVHFQQIMGGGNGIRNLDSSSVNWAYDCDPQPFTIAGTQYGGPYFHVDQTNGQLIKKIHLWYKKQTSNTPIDRDAITLFNSDTGAELFPFDQSPQVNPPRRTLAHVELREITTMILFKMFSLLPNSQFTLVVHMELTWTVGRAKAHLLENFGITIRFWKGVTELASDTTTLAVYGVADGDVISDASDPSTAQSTLCFETRDQTKSVSVFDQPCGSNIVVTLPTGTDAPKTGPSVTHLSCAPYVGNTKWHQITVNGVSGYVEAHSVHAKLCASTSNPSSGSSVLSGAQCLRTSLPNTVLFTTPCGPTAVDTLAAANSWLIPEGEVDDIASCTTSQRWYKVLSGRTEGYIGQNSVTFTPCQCLNVNQGANLRDKPCNGKVLSSLTTDTKLIALDGDVAVTSCTRGGKSYLNWKHVQFGNNAGYIASNFVDNVMCN